MDAGLTHRLATHADLPLLSVMVDAAIAENQRAFLTEEQIDSSRAIMGIDTQLIDDGTYFVIALGGRIAGSGGWSRRATLYGSNQTSGRDAALLNPKMDAARVRAMYTHPQFTRRGVGRLIMRLCEDGARSEGFKSMELMSTLSGRPLYEACGFVAIEEVNDNRGGVSVPLLLMRKLLN